MHEIYNSFDDGLELRNIFLGNSKAFDKVTHKSILFWIVVKWYTLVTSYTSHLVFLVIENKALFFMVKHLSGEMWPQAFLKVPF